MPSPSSPEDEVFQVETETISFPRLPPSEVSSPVKNDGEDDENEISEENEQEELDDDNEREEIDDENEHEEEVDESVSQAQSPLNSLTPVIIPDELSPNKVLSQWYKQNAAMFFLFLLVYIRVFTVG